MTVCLSVCPSVRLYIQYIPCSVCSSPEVVAAPQGPEAVRGPGEQPGKIGLFLLKDVTFWCPFFENHFSKDTSLLLDLAIYIYQ